MLRPKWQIDFFFTVFVLISSAWSQTARYMVPAALLGDDFSSYHHALDNAADLALANMHREAVMSSQTDEAPTNATDPPDATTLHQFAEQYWNGNDEAVRRAVGRVAQLRLVLTPILHDEGIPNEIERASCRERV